MLVIVGFAAAMAAVNRIVRRLESDGRYEVKSDSTAVRPGVRSLFDYGAGGFSEDGNRQRKV